MLNTDPEREAFSGGKTSSGTWIALGSIAAGAALAALIFFAFIPGPKSDVPEWVPEGPPPIQTIQIEVTSTPPGARVVLDDGGVPLARTPGRVSLMPGAHELRFELPGFPIRRVGVDTAKDRSAATTWDGVVLAVTSKPEGAALLLDGGPLGFAPYTLALPRGEKPYELRARMEGQPEQVFVFQPTQDITRLFDFTAPASASAPASSASGPSRAGGR
jgi:hypothetical protein